MLSIFLASWLGSVFFKILDAIIGLSDRATTVENATATDIAMANSVNSLPRSPFKKVIGVNTAISTSEVATIANPT